MPRLRVSALGLSAGMFADLPSNTLLPRQSPSLGNVMVRRGFLRPRTGLKTFGDRPNNDPIIKLFSARRESGSSSLFRIKNRSDGGQGEIRIYSGGIWSAVTSDAGLANANGSLLGVDTDAWDAATVLDKPVFVNGVNENVYYDPVVPNLKPLGGAKSRYVVMYNGRIVLAYQDDAGIKINQVQLSAPGTFNDFAGLGSNKTQLRDDAFPIAGLSVNRRLTIYKERSIVIGTPNPGNYRTPISYQTINTGGVGLLVPGAIGHLGTLDVFLASDDFYTFDGTGIPQPLEAPIRELLFQTLNSANARQAHTIHDPDHGEVYFFIASGSDRFPKEAWVWNYRMNAWWHWTFSGALGASAAHAVSSDVAWNAPANSAPWLESTGSWADLLAVSARLTLIAGEAGPITAPATSTTYGRTFEFNATQRIDQFNSPSNVTWYYDLPDRDFDGVSEDESRRPIKTVRARDWKLLEQVDVVYLDLGGMAPTLQLSVSTDEGQTFTPFESQTLTYGPGGVQMFSFFGRIAGQRLRLRITGDSKDAAIRDVSMYFALVGEGK